MIFTIVACGKNETSSDVSSTDSSNITSSKSESEEDTSSTTHSDVSSDPSLSKPNSSKPVDNSKPTVSTFLPTGDTFTLGTKNTASPFLMILTAISLIQKSGRSAPNRNVAI